MKNPKNIVITGANSGVGYESAKALYEDGHNIIFGSRNTAKNEEAIKEITARQGGSIKSFGLDLSQRKSVENFAKYVKESFVDRIDILMNNAGLVMGKEMKNNEDGIEMTLAINHFGHFYLTYLLWDLIVKSPEARIINVSSRAHYGVADNFLDDIKCQNKEYDAFDQYKISKLLNVLFALGLNNLIQEQGLKNIKTASLHPGVVDSGFYTNLTQESCLIKFCKALCCCCFIDNTTGARAQLHLSRCPFAEIRSGEYYNEDTNWKEMDKQGRKPDNVKKLWKISEEVYQIKFA